MNLNVEIADRVGEALRTLAQSKGISPDRLVREVLNDVLSPMLEDDGERGPFETGFGMWSRYGSAPSAEEIAENRREMFVSLAHEIR